MQKSVCVIGAGLSGLASTKCMKEAGFSVTCFDKNQFVGGRWHKENADPIPRTTVTNLPKFMSCFSDFPLPNEYPLYISADQYADYFQSYAENFGLLQYIKLNHEVVTANPICVASEEKEREETNLLGDRWSIKYLDENQAEHIEEFDFLVVSSGFYTIPFIPKRIQSVVKNFTGKLLHSLEFENAESFKDETVVVCGLGNTGGDIAVESSKCAHKTIISTSRGSYVMGRLVSNGEIPIAASLNRLAGYVPTFLSKIFRQYFISKMSNHVADINKWKLKPSTFSVIVNDEFLFRIAYGKIEVRRGIERIDGKTVYFTDGKVIESVDTLVLCTGYVRKFPFLDESIISPEREGKYLPLYKGMFPLQHNRSLAFVGMFSIISSVAITSELQARYVAERFKNNIQLPNQDEMKNSIEEQVKNLDDLFSGEMKELNIIMEPWDYYQQLADEIGCRPSIGKLMLTDPILFWHLSTKFSFHEFRLVGPNKWNGARDAILNQEKSTYGWSD